ncbi:MAG: nucleotidyltransferase domain-containing protein [Acidobacteriota bacterium]
MSTRESGESLETAIGAALAGTAEVAAAYLYGSAARQTATGLSDVDIALVASGEVMDEERGQLLRQVTMELERLCRGSRFDVRFLDELPAAIAGRVVGEGKLVFETDPRRRVAAEVRARMLYHDFLPFERYGTRVGIAELRRRLDVG